MIGNFANIELQSFVFKRVAALDPSDTSNYLINLNNIAATVNSTIMITGIQVEECPLTFFTISNSQQSKSIAQSITLTNVSVRDTTFAYGDNMMEFQNIQTDTGSIVFSKNSNLD